MIVKVGAWLFIINAVIGVLASVAAPFGMAVPAMATMLWSGLFIAVGVGLLYLQVWGRWLALGLTLISWTLGSLAVIWLVGWAISAGVFGAFLAALVVEGPLGVVARWVMLVLLLTVVTIIIDFKLFFHLWSKEGCEEFGVPYGSIEAVVLSAVAWLAFFYVDNALRRDDALAQLAAIAGQRRHLGSERADMERARMERDREQLREYEQSRARAEPATQPVEQREEDQARRREEMNRIRAEEAARREAEQRASRDLQTSADKQADEKPTTRILKCRDASGGITFTQGYCPPGTKLVEMPASE